MERSSIALMIYGEPGSTRNAITVEKYKKLAAHLIEKDFAVDSVLYHDSASEKLSQELLHYDAILVWVNPIEQQGDRKMLDALLARLSVQGVFVSCHPDTILKMGTKDILYKTKDEEFGGDVKIYASFKEFKERFLSSMDANGIRILKQYRGNGGNGVFKIDATEKNKSTIKITQATEGDKEMAVTVDEFFSEFEQYFDAGSLLIDQAWNVNITNGMVRCYLCGNKVAGFGYQEINALYPIKNGVFKKPGQRFYFSEDCSLFSDLKNSMETSWVNRLQKLTGINNDRLPIIWDADFFINDPHAENPGDKYELCEINVSCVSPFPESAIPYIAEELKNRIKK